MPIARPPPLPSRGMMPFRHDFRESRRRSAPCKCDIRALRMMPAA
jgi:hypothetical protein